MSGTVTLNGLTYKITLTEMPITNEGNGQVMNGPMMNGEMMGGKKKKKQEGGKSRKLSPYMKFAQKVRPELIKENPALRSDIPGMGKAIGAKWRALSEEEKKRF